MQKTNIFVKISSFLHSFIPSFRMFHFTPHRSIPIFIILLFSGMAGPSTAQNNAGLVAPPNYHTYEEIIALADSLAQFYPSICKKVIFGSSIGGRQLAALKISDNVELEETEPEILFDGGCHGDEIGGPENLIRFARDLCQGYGTDTVITPLVNTREIWLYLMVNPDGRANNSRFNDAMVDINRDYGYMWDASGGSTGAFSQPETRGVRDCLEGHRFSVYVSYHSGLQQVAYPWAYRGEEPRDKPNLRRLAKTYSDSSLYPSLPYGQSYTIMYQSNGMSVDYDYGSFGQACMTVELSNDKQPPDPLVYYNYNYPAMIEMIRMSGWGAEGMVTDSLTGQPVDAAIWIDNFFPCYSDPALGDFHKYVLPGPHTGTVTANGYLKKENIFFNVPQQGAAVLTILLTPDSGSYASRVASCRIPGGNPADEGYTPGCLLRPDSIAYSIGKSGWIVLDMGDTVVTGDGNDLMVYEAGMTDEGFHCFAGNNEDGPWEPLGDGSGTTGFDLGSLNDIRYIRIVDDGDDTAGVSDAGYDLDAIVSLHSPGPWLMADHRTPPPGLTIWPNPGPGLFRIHGTNITGGMMTITDITGRIVARKNISFSTVQIDLTSLAPGIYRCTLQSGAVVVSASLVKL
jgi:hypothetical protein